MKTYRRGALSGFDPTQTASLNREFGSIKEALERAVPDLAWEYRHAEPDKISAGMEVIADGVDWDPGAIGVAGKYRRNEANTAWVLLESTAVAAALAAHLADTTDAHAGSAITNTPAGNISSITVQAAINELDTEKQPLDATLTALAAANWAANALPIGTGADTLAQTSFAANTFPARASAGNLVAKTITDFGLSLVDDADAAAGRTTLALNNVTNDAQTKAAIVPNTAPAAGGMLVGNAGATAYAPVAASGAVTLASTGAFSLATPGTLTVSTTNTGGTGAHVHTITSSNNPGAAASLVATDASGHIGVTANRIVKIWAIDLTVTNNIAGSITGNAATVTTNANLTGPITSSGNATAIASQTGTGTKFVMDTSPTLVTPALGVATATSVAATSGGVSAAGTFTSTGSTTALTVIDTGANGGNIKITGNGATTPDKYIGVSAGSFRVGNSAFTANLISITDGGQATVSSGLTCAGTGGLGYSTGAGGTQTQLTNKATGVTLSKPSGQITMNAAALAAATTVSFTLTNTTIAATDTIDVHRASGGTAAAYNVWVDSVAAGSCVVCVRNISAGSLSEAVVLNFTICKGASS